MMVSVLGEASKMPLSGTRGSAETSTVSEARHALWHMASKIVLQVSRALSLPHPPWEAVAKAIRDTMATKDDVQAVGTSNNLPSASDRATPSSKPSQPLL